MALREEVASQPVGERIFVRAESEILRDVRGTDEDVQRFFGRWIQNYVPLRGHRQACRLAAGGRIVGEKTAR